MGNKGTLNKSTLEIVNDRDFLFKVGYLLFVLMGLLISPLFYPVLLLNLVYREETLRNVIKSVTKNGKSILITVVLGLIVILLFAIVAHKFFPEVIHIDLKDDNKEYPCKISLSKCYLTHINYGLRNGGGIGDIMYPASTEESGYYLYFAFVLVFFTFIITIVQLIFGIILDQFGALRSEKESKEQILRDTCFVCGLHRSDFEKKNVKFDDHVKYEHNLWHYLYFIVLVRVKNSTEFTGPESYVNNMIKNNNLEWFPRKRAITLGNQI